MPFIWKNFDHVFEVFRFESWVKKQVEKQILNITSGFFAILQSFSWRARMDLYIFWRTKKKPLKIKLIY